MVVPHRYKTRLCSFGSNCNRPICFFAHAADELRCATTTETDPRDSDEQLMVMQLIMGQQDGGLGQPAVQTGSGGSSVLAGSGGSGGSAHLSQHRSTLLSAASADMSMLMGRPKVSMWKLR